MGDLRMNHVLVADDSYISRRLVEISLGQIQLDVTSVPSGEAACEALTESAPDLLIVDAGLPDMSGWDVLEFARGRDELVGMPIVMLTANGDAEAIDRVTDSGADAYVAKPCRPSELRRVVVDVIHGAARTHH